MNNNTELSEELPPLYQETYEETQLSYENNTEFSEESPPLYEDNDEEAQLFLNETSKHETFKKKIINCLIITLFISINIAVFFLFVKPLIIDTCNNPVINSNTTCHHQYVCDHDNRCGYVDICDLEYCNSIMHWIFILLIGMCLPSTMIFTCLMKFFDYITGYKYL